jgi:ribosomal protein S18 acetylase RimI-like enzyme
METLIRELSEPDLLAADEILKLTFGGPVSRLEDMHLYRRIQPDGWFVASQADHLVGMVGAVNYGALAHVGLMAVHPDFQRQGIGRSLMQFLLDRLDQQGVPLVTLDASKMGQPLYEQLGFEPYDETITFQRSAENPAGAYVRQHRMISAGDLDELVQIDTDAFGANRRKVFEVLLDQFPGRAYLQRSMDGRLEGYLFAQKYRLGPWVMVVPSRAEGLLLTGLALPFEGITSATVPAGNQEAVGLLQELGFKQIRVNLHMGRGHSRPPGQRERIFSQTSLAVG